MAKKLWGGRFKKKTDPLVEVFTKSIQFDKKLILADIYGSILHVCVLYKSGIIREDEKNKLIAGLKTLDDQASNGTLSPGEDVEDIHTYIQNQLEAMPEVGDLALKLHTLRSRNDQVALATKFYTKKELLTVRSAILELIRALWIVGMGHKDVRIPGFTHLQHAQPILLKDYLLAYGEMLGRDENRLNYIAKNMVISFGAGALAGTPIDYSDYEKAAKEFIKSYPYAKDFKISATVSSLDVVSDRDFIIEVVDALSIIAMHLSRLAEDLIIWCTKEFDFVEIDEAYCTGSSLMPQKKNPDALELIRGNTGRFYGNLMSVLTMMKGLPLSYNRDMQLDKEPLFNSIETITMELKIMKGIIETLKFNEDAIKKHLEDESLYVTDLVYYLVKKKRIPFATAHTLIGELVAYSLKTGKDIKKMNQSELNRISDKLVKDEIMVYFDPGHSIALKTSFTRKSMQKAVEKSLKSLQHK